MRIFYKCSFKSSGGYKLACYDYDLDELHYIPEDDNIYKEKISKTVLSTFNYGLGRSMVLASDEAGGCFFGIYGLSEEDSGKYINAVFMDKENINIFYLFNLFCIQYNQSGIILKNTVKRKTADENGLEFFIVKEEIQRLLEAAAGTGLKFNIRNSNNKLFAFITEENYSDYITKISQNCLLDTRNAILKGNITHNQECLDLENVLTENSSKHLWYYIASIIIIVVMIIMGYVLL